MKIHTSKINKIHTFIFAVVSFLFVIAGIVQISNSNNANAADNSWKSGVTAVSAGQDSNCAISSGKAYCWGSNTYGQLGTGTNSTYFAPVAVNTAGVLNGKTITAISKGDIHTCAVADGQAYCWGSNGYGQLGNNSTTNSSVPVAVDTTGVLNGKTITAISAGDTFTCAIADGHAYCWGGNTHGQLGNDSIPTNISALTPVAVDTTGVLDGKTVTAISTGAAYACVIASGQVYCWGYNSWGQLGNGSVNTSLTPVAVNTSGVLAGKTVTAISTGSISQNASHTCAVANGQAYCWGYNNSGQLGNNSTTNSSTPVAVDTTGVLSGKIITAISNAGSSGQSAAHTCAVADSQAYCWGNNKSSQLGNGNVTTSLVPVAVDTSGVLNGKTITAISTGDIYTCAIADEQVSCWGNNFVGQLGNNSVTNSSTPIAVEAPSLRVLGLSTRSITIDGTEKTTSITGSDFEPGAIVKFGNQDATVKSSEPSLVTVTIPTAGITQTTTVDVTVTNPDSTSFTLPNAFTYTVIPPQINIVSPSALVVDGSDKTVTLSGLNFAAGATVKFGDQEVDVQTGGSSYSLAVTIPTAGITQTTTVDVTVINPGGVSFTLPNAFTYTVLHPKIDSISPSTVAIDGNDKLVVLDGSDFAAGATVKFGNQDVDVQNYGTQLYVTVPTAGITQTTTVDVTVINPNGTSFTLQNAFTYKTPDSKQITGVTFSKEGESTLLTVTGLGLVGESNPSEYAEGLTRSLVSLNGQSLPFCAAGLGQTAQEVVDTYSIDPSLVSDHAPCYDLVSGGAVAITPTKATVFLPNNFNITAPGIVSVNNSPAFSFNQPASGSGGVSATVGDKTLDNHPTIVNKPTFSGTAAPGSTVTVTVHSDPVTCTTTADSNGNWSCTLPASLPAGEHTVYIAVTAPDNTVINLGPYTVTVDGETPTTIPGVPNTGIASFLNTKNNILGFVSLGVSLLLIGGMVYKFICHRRASVRFR